MAHLADADLVEQVQWSVKPPPQGGSSGRSTPPMRRTDSGRTAARPLDLWVPFARIEAPVLVLRGAESDILASATAGRMCKVNKQAKTVEVPGVGHAPSLTEPEALAALKNLAAIKKFFAL